MFDDVNDKLSYWMTLFLSVVDRHAPLMKVRLKKKSQDDDWIDSELRSLMRTRNYHIRRNIVRPMLSMIGIYSKLSGKK